MRNHAINKFIAGPDAAEIAIMGEIGWEVRAADIIGALDWAGDRKVVLNIYSPGGAALDAVAVYDYIRDKGLNVEARIYGLCGSAATVIACAAAKTYIGASSFYFIHRAYISGSDHSDGERYTLDQLNKRLEDIYVSRSGLGKRRVRELLDKGDDHYFLTAAEAVELGFADGTLDEAKMAAHFEKFRGQAAPTNPNDGMSQEQEKPEVVDTPAPEAAVNEAPENDTAPEVVTEEVEVQLSIGERISGKARVNVSAEMKAQLEAAIEERKTFQAQAEELSAELDRSKEAFAEVSAEAQAKTDQLAEALAKVEELEAKLKAPLAAPTASADVDAPDVQDPTKSNETKPTPARGTAPDVNQRIAEKLKERRKG